MSAMKRDLGVKDTHAQRHLVAAKQLAPAILRDIVELSEHHEEEEEPDATRTGLTLSPETRSQAIWLSV